MCLAWDSTCVDTVAPSNVGHSVAFAGKSANVAEAAKMEKYRELINRIIFVPLGFETIGGWGSECSKLVTEIGNLVMKKTGEKRASVFLRQRLSVAIQRGNAASILGSFPPGSILGEIFSIP